MFPLLLWCCFWASPRLPAFPPHTLPTPEHPHCPQSPGLLLIPKENQGYAFCCFLSFQLKIECEMPRDLKWGTLPITTSVAPFSPSLSLLLCYNALRKPSSPSVLMVWASAPRDFSTNFLLSSGNCSVHYLLTFTLKGRREATTQESCSIYASSSHPTTFFLRGSAGPPSDSSLSVDKGRSLFSSSPDTTGFQVGALQCEPRPQIGLVSCGNIVQLKLTQIWYH